MDDMVRMCNDPKYLASAEAEIELALKQAKIDLSQLGFDLDQEFLQSREDGTAIEEAKEEGDD